MNEMDLTSDRLAGLPRRSTTMFISDYLQCQNLYRDRYATEGLSVSRTWDGSTTVSSQEKVSQDVTGGASTHAIGDYLLLETPLLRPRVVPNSTRRPETAKKLKDNQQPQIRSKRTDTIIEGAKPTSRKNRSQRKSGIVDAQPKQSDQVVLPKVLDNEHSKRAFIINRCGFITIIWF